MTLADQIKKSFSPDFTIKIQTLPDGPKTTVLVQRLRSTLTTFGYQYLTNEDGTTLFVKDIELR